MSDKNLTLYVASYGDDTSATDDFELLKAARDAAEVKVVAAVVATRDASGKVDVKEHDAGRAHRAIGWGAVGGFVVGLFSPPLLAATAVGGAIGGGLHELVKHHEEKGLEADADAYLPPGSSAIIAVVDDEYADRLDKVLTHSTKKVTRAIDDDSPKKLSKALTNAGYDIEAALES